MVKLGKHCEHCGKPLNQSQYAQNGTLKSCPRCSTEDGKEHIFYRYPMAFGQSAKRASASIPDGVQSWCVLCRGDDFGPHRGALRCSEVD